MARRIINVEVGDLLRFNRFRSYDLTHDPLWARVASRARDTRPSVVFTTLLCGGEGGDPYWLASPEHWAAGYMDDPGMAIYRPGEEPDAFWAALAKHLLLGDVA